MTDSDDLPRWFKFRAFGVLRPGFMKVEFVAPPQRLGVVTLWDIFVEELPINLVPMELRMPNSEFWVRLDRDQEPVAVQANLPTDMKDYE